jgi:hypothetical protein
MSDFMSTSGISSELLCDGTSFPFDHSNEDPGLKSLLDGVKDDELNVDEVIESASSMLALSAGAAQVVDNSSKSLVATVGGTEIPANYMVSRPQSMADCIQNINVVAQSCSSTSSELTPAQVFQMISFTASCQFESARQIQGLTGAVVNMQKDVSVMRSDVDGIHKRLAVLEGLTDEVNRCVSGNACIRDCIKFLCVVGMDTRFGFICAWPVFNENNWHLVISLHLLSYAGKTLFPQAEFNISQMKVAFKSLMKPDRVLVNKALLHMPHRSTSISNANALSTWVTLRYDTFLKMKNIVYANYCNDIDHWKISTDRFMLDEYGISTLKFNTRMTINTNKSNGKIVWGHPVIQRNFTKDIMEFVKTFHNCTVENVHFSLISVFPDELMVSKYIVCGGDGDDDDDDFDYEGGAGAGAGAGASASTGVECCDEGSSEYSDDSECRNKKRKRRQRV